MREHLARIVAALSAVLILLVVLAFGWIQNRRADLAQSPAAPERVLVGRQVYESQGCGICHTIAGEGDSQYPLDGIGARMTPEQLRLNIAPSDDMKPGFPEAVFEIKLGYRALPQQEMDALIDYLRSLR